MKKLIKEKQIRNVKSNHLKETTQLTFTCSNSTTETLEKRVKYVHS